MYSTRLGMFIFDYLSTQNCTVKTMYIPVTVGSYCPMTALFSNLNTFAASYLNTQGN